MKAFINGRMFINNQFIQDKVVITDREDIVDIVDRVPSTAEIIDLEGAYLIPGLIDLQIYGGGGYLFSSELSLHSLQVIADDLVKKGTTGFYITLATNSFDVFRQAVEVVKKCTHPAVMGIQLEGPYMNPVKKGAHLEKYVKKPDLAELREFLENAGGTVKMMTLAPEECSQETINLLHQYGILVSAGHSNATFAEAMSGFSWGIDAVTHLYNAMSPLHHRDVGLPGATFQHADVNASIIPDGIHVDYEAVKIAKEMLRERLFFITDAVEEVREGEYVHIRQKDRFTLADGTLSGSALTMPLAIKNGVEKIGLTLEESVRMGTIYPAKLAKLDKRGEIKVGNFANLNCLDADLNLKFTVLNGEVIPA